MSETTTTRQYVYESPEIEAYKMGLYGSAKDYIQQLQGFDADGKGGGTSGALSPPVGRALGFQGVISAKRRWTP